MSDVAIMSDANVTITKTLAVMNGVRYSTNSISAISIKEISPGFSWIIWTVVVGRVAIEALDHGGVGGLVCAAIVAVVIYLRPTMTYSLVFRSAGSDAPALDSRDSAYLGRVKGAIEEAVRLRERHSPELIFSSPSPSPERAKQEIESFGGEDLPERPARRIGSRGA